MEMYVQRAYSMYYCVVVALSMILYFWYQDQNSYRSFQWPYYDWFIIHFLLVVMEIIACFLLQKKVKKSYIKTYRWLRLNKRDLRKTKGKYRTVVEVLAPSKRSLRLGLILLDLIYCGMGVYGLFIYQERLELINKDFSDTTLLSTILPFLSILGTLMLLRAFASTFFFLLIPRWSVKDQRKIFMKLGGGLYSNAKFPMLKYRDYVLQLQRFSLHELNERDQENESNAKCRLCGDQTQMDDDIVVLPCNFQHFFMKDCIHEWFAHSEVCPLCRFEVFNYHNYINETAS